MATQVEIRETVDMVSDERWSWDVVEWIDKDDNHGFEVTSLGEGLGFARQLQGSAKRIILYEVKSDTSTSTSDVCRYVEENPKLEDSEISEGE
jgi:hypothetical protein